MRTYVYGPPMPDTDTYDRPGPDDWIAIGEAASLLGLSVKTLRRYDQNGQLTAVRTPGGRRRYRRADILNALRGAA